MSAAVLLLLLTACAPKDPQQATFLGAAVVTDAALTAVGRTLRSGDDPTVLAEVTSARYGGAVPVTVTYTGEPEDLCGSCTGGVYAVALVLDDVRILGDDYGEAADADFDCAMDMGDCDADFDFTPPPFTLRGAMALQAAVQVRDDDELSVDVVGGTVEPAALEALGQNTQVTVTASLGWGDYHEDVELSGTVDGAPYGYDYHTMD